MGMPSEPSTKQNRPNRKQTHRVEEVLKQREKAEAEATRMAADAAVDIV